MMDGVPVEEPRRETVTGGMGGIINRVAVYKNYSDVIGYSFLYFSTEMLRSDKIKLLSVDGVEPSKKAIQDGTYRFTEDFYALFIDADEKNANIEPLINWILSAQGQELIAKTGYTPIKAYP